MSEVQEQVPAATPSKEDVRAAAAASAEEVVELPDVQADQTESAPAALTSDDVAGKPSERPKTYASEIKELARTKEEPTPTGLEREIADLRTALDGLAEPQTEQELSFEQKMLAKLESLENRFITLDQEDAKAREEEEYNNRVRTLREGVIENLRAEKEKFPGLIALGQEETVFNNVFLRAQEGLDTSEVEVASEVEDGLKEVYKTLHAVYGSATSSEDQPGSEPKQTLTPGLSASGEVPDTTKMSKQQLRDYLWEKSLQS